MSKKNLIINFFQRYFNIQPREFKLVQLFFIDSTLISLFYTASSSVSDALFVNYYSTHALQSVLPWIYISTGIASICITAFYNNVISKTSRIKFIIISDVIFAASIALFRILIYLPALHTWIYFALIVWVEALSIFKIMLFFSCLGDYFPPSRARQVYGYVTLGMALGSILAGILVDRLTIVMNVASILYITAVILLFCALVGKAIYGSAYPIRSGLVSIKKSPPIKFLTLLKNHYLKIIFLIMGTLTIAYIVSDYIMLIVASKTLKGDALAQFFAKFYGYIGLCELIIELFLASYLLKRFGVIKVLFILPILILASTILFINMQTLFSAALIYFIFLSLYETIDMIARELLFLPLSERIRIKGQATTEGILASLAKIIGGGFLLTFAMLHAPFVQYAFLLIVLTLIWLICLMIVSPFYKKELVASILKPGLFSQRFPAISAGFHRLMDSHDMQSIIKSELQSGDETRQLLILNGLTKHAFISAKNIVNTLFQSNKEKIVKKIIKLYGKFGCKEDLPVLQPFLFHKNKTIQLKAISTYSRLGKKEAIPVINKFVTSDILPIKFIALYNCYKFGEISQKDVMLQKIKTLIQQNKIYGIKFLAKVSDPAFIPEINALLIDENDKIRNKAIFAAVKNPDVSYIPHLIQNLLSSSINQSLVLQVLFKMPESAIEKLKTYILDASIPDHIYSILLRAIAKIGGEKGIDIVLSSLAICSDQKNLAASFDALQLILTHPIINKNTLDKLHSCQEHFYQHIMQLRQLYLAIPELPENQQHLFHDIIYFYARIYFTLIGMEYRIFDLPHLFDIAHIEKSDIIELLQTALPRKIFIASVPLASPIDQKGAAKIESTVEFIKELMNKDIWISSLILYSRNVLTSNKFISEEYVMSENQRQMVERINTMLYLKQIELFSLIPTNYLLNITDIVHEETFYPNENIINEGEKGNSLYLICNGRVLVHHDGKKVTELGPGECIGELTIIDRLPRSATVTALTEVRVLRIDAEDFNFVLSMYPEIAKRLLKILAKRVRKSD